MTKRSVLIVEPDAVLSRSLGLVCEELARVTRCADFQGARARLLEDRPDFLVTNLRLAEYNGLHLVLLSQLEQTKARCIVYTDRPDFALIAEAQRDRAVFEWTARLPFALPGYMLGPWPGVDRRSANRIDRRRAFRGGRRAPDTAQVFPLVFPTP